jgi:small redox-active disulfide protein 2
MRSFVSREGAKMLRIKILGAGCSNCERLYEVTRKAVESLGVEAEIAKITDYPEMMKYNILQTPALVIEEKVVTAGRVPSLAEMTSMLTTALAKTGG